MPYSEIEIYSDKKLNLLAKCIYEKMLRAEPTQTVSRRLSIKQQAKTLIQEYEKGIK